MVKSLQKLATESCIHGLRYLYDVGDAPYKLVRPVLMKIGDPEQLLEIELKSPQVCGEDEEIWRRFIIRDIPTGNKWLDERDLRIAAEDAEDEAEGREVEHRRPDWWKIYQKLKKKAEKASVDCTANLQAVLNQKNAEKRSNTTTIGADLKVPKTGRYGQSASSSSSKPSKQMSLMDKARKQAREASQGRGLLQTSHGVIKPNPGRTVFPSSSRPAAPKAPPTLPASSPALAAQTREEAMARREAALRRAQEGSAPAGGFTPVKRPSSNVFVANKRRKR